MVNSSAIATVFSVYAAAVVIPGPNFVAITQKAVAGRRSDALALVAGIVTVNLFWATCAILGIGMVFAIFPWLAVGIRLAGAAYLIWLAIQLWRSDAAPVDTSKQGDTSMWKLARHEFLVAAGNPKAILVFTAFLPQFVNISQPMLPQFTILGTSFLVLEWVSIALYSAAGMYLGRWLTRAKVRRWFNRTCGTFLGAIGLSFLLVRHS